ncbi:hypothetical protein FIBSPDRAFT_948027 [Athelia psychrophila]|uniref:Uncharacterized protein n=1 Tax=Athelia psychrophila TaxID=1759441 RepID=A0A166RCE1_9AGAM|nr:hypothetical protein FIBSPDRAFT_948027 [Fibularhizoctonia sp. CBS 109695]
MGSSSLLHPTTASTTPLALDPVSESLYLRLQSEIISTSLGDTGYLRRTNHLHPLVLSTVNGFQLGPGRDPTGEPYTDYVFLHAGLTIASETQTAPTPVNAFVRVFTQQTPDLPTPWLLPYPSAPISIPRPESPLDISALSIYPSMRGHYARNSKTVNRISEPISRPVPDDRFITRTPLNNGDITVDTAMTAWSSTSSIRRSARIASLPTARAITDSPPHDSRITKRRRAASSDGDYHPPPDRSRARVPSPMNTDIDTEWDQLEREITAEIAEEMAEEIRNGELHQREQASLRRFATELEEERRLNDDRAHFKFALQYLTGLTPTDDLVDTLQDESPDTLPRLLALPQFNPTPPVSPIIVARAKIPFAPAVPANAPSPVELLLGIANIPPSSAKKPLHNWPAPTPVKLELATNPTARPIPVFHVRVIPDEKEGVAEDLHKMRPREAIDIVSQPESVSFHPVPPGSLPQLVIQSSPPPQFTPMLIHEDSSNSDCSTDSLDSTEPSSPIVAIPRVDPFAHSRSVNRDGLINILSAEEARIAPTASHPYQRQLRRTISRVQSLQDSQTGMLKPFRIFLLGLMELLDLEERSRIRSAADFDATSGERKSIAHVHTPLPLPSPPHIAPVSLDESEPESEYPASISSRRRHNQDDDDPDNTPPSLSAARPTKIPQCRSRPPNFIDPRVIPIGLRAYHGMGSNNPDRELSCTVQRIPVDIRTYTIIQDPSPVPCEYIRSWSVMGGALEGLIFPGSPIPSSRHSLPVASSTADHWMGRVRELQIRRQNVELVHQFASESLTAEEQQECRSSVLIFYKRLAPNSDQLGRVRVDRAYAHARMHPVWSPLVKSTEAAFLRTAAYFMCRKGQQASADRIDQLLRTPENDDWEIREMVCRGSLEDAHRADECLRYFEQVDDEHWDYHAAEDNARAEVREWYRVRCGSPSSPTGSHCSDLASEID